VTQVTPKGLSEKQQRDATLDGPRAAR
jgi:hypothetical protein